MQTSRTSELPLSQGRPRFHRNFYIANTMEIFERLAWFGFFTLSSLYMTSPRAQGGLGFSDQERGFLQGMIPFILYLLPVLTGALADRYGYRKMFLLAFSIMAPSYYLLGQVHSFSSFMLVFLAVAIGAACFKPVVVGTIARNTDASNRGLGFGIFYTMVNIGGFLGPLIAGYVRAISWDLVFIMSACWISLNFLPALFLYRDQEAQHELQDRRGLAAVLGETRAVLGNARLALLVVPAILGVMLAAKGVFSYAQYAVGMLLWLLLNLLWSQFYSDARSDSATPTASRWYRQRIQVGDRKFVMYLLILTGFWTVYNQLPLTAPLFIRDYIDTADLVRWLANWNPAYLDFFAAVNPQQIQQVLPELMQKWLQASDATQLNQLRLELVNYKIMVPLDELQRGFSALQAQQLSPAELSQRWIQNYRQINPEYLINLSFAVIVLLQIWISHVLQRWRALPVLVAGTLLLAVAMVLAGYAMLGLAAGALTVVAIVVFSLGEMIASPKSQEYVAALAPPNKSAMFMGYYFVSMALGNLFGGLLSGWAYGEIAKKANQPLLMWIMFAVIAVATALLMLIFDRHLKSSQAAQSTGN